MATLLYESYYGAESPDELYLMHHGIKGQKWGVRRFQNADGSLTADGKSRYQTGNGEGRRRLKTAAKVIGAAAITGAAAYGAYKLGKRSGILNPIDDAARADMLNAAKRRRMLSDEEIRKRIEKIKLERELHTLTMEELRPGRAMTKEILTNVGKKTLTTMITGGILYGTKYAITRIYDPIQMAGYVTPKPKK